MVGQRTLTNQWLSADVGNPLSSPSVMDHINQHHYMGLTIPDPDNFEANKEESWVDKMRKEQIQYNIAMDNYLRSNPIKEEPSEKIGEDKHRSPLYFTPSIEDIRVGYECEIYMHPMSSNLYADLPLPKWISHSPFEQDTYMSGYDSQYDMYTDLVKLEEIRVPYLTKEQLEKEGWKEVTKTLSAKGWLPVYQKKDRLLEHFPEVHQINITDTYIPEENCYFSGECEDINTFRYICKLLNIK